MTGDRDWQQLKRVGGQLCLDFVNTVDRVDNCFEEDWLKSYADLLGWSRFSKNLTDEQTDRLRQLAHAQPQAAERIFETAIALRETLFRIFAAIAADQPVPSADLATLNAVLVKTLPWLQLVPEAEGLTWDWSTPETQLDSVLWQITRSAADLLTQPERDRLRKCMATDCGWVFLDLSRNRSRRWCDMETCGNRSKARQFYQRQTRNG